jgi:hypothetical protein
MITNNESTIRNLDVNELDVVSGGWSVGSTGDGGVRIEVGNRGLSIHSNGATYWNGSSFRFFRW